MQTSFPGTVQFWRADGPTTPPLSWTPLRFDLDNRPLRGDTSKSLKLCNSFFPFEGAIRLVFTKVQRAKVQRATVQRAKVQRTKDRCSPSAEQFEFRTAARNVSRNGLNVYLFNGYERHTTKKCRKRKKKETCFRSFFSLLSIFLLRERERVEKKSERESERGALKKKRDRPGALKA